MTQTRVQVATELRDKILSVENDEGRKEANLNPEEIEDNYEIWKGAAKALKEEWEREKKEVIENTKMCLPCSTSFVNRL